MAKMTPTLNDWSSGFISKKMAGRVDNPLLLKGAKEMLNFMPDKFGAVTKRGGLQHKMYDVCDGKAALLKWSINKEVDLIFAFEQNSIKIINVSNGMEPAFVQVGGVDLVITSFLIDEDILSEISYAQNLRTMVICHESFKPIKFEFVDILLNEIKIKYQNLEFTGNIAETKETTVKALYKDVSYNSLKSALGNISVNGTYTTTASTIKVSGTVYDITTVVITRTTTARKLSLKGSVGLGFPYNVATYTDASPNITGNIIFAAGTTWRWMFPLNQFSTKDELNMEYTTGTTWTAIFSAIESKPLESGKLYYAASNRGWYSTKSPAEMRYSQASYSEVIRINYGTESAYVELDSSLDPDVAIILKIPVQTNVEAEVSISGQSASVGEAIGRLAPWMDDDVVYECAKGDEYKIGTATPSSASKSTDDGKQVISIFLADNAGVYKMDENSDQFVGKVGIILTPFYRGVDWPSAVCFHSGRLCLSSGNTVYMSKVNEYQNFCYFEDVIFESTEILPSDEWAFPGQEEWVTVTDSVQQTGASSAIKLKLATDEDEIVQWMISAQGLHIGTSTSEWLFPDGLDATNPRVVIMGRTGSARIRPLFCDNRILFVSSSLRQIFALDPQSPVGSSSMTEHAEDIFDSNIVSMDFRQFPQSEIYAVFANGKAVVGRMNAAGLYGWSRLETKTSDEILAVTVVFAGDEDAVYFLVDRSNTICLERLHTSVNTDFSTRRYLDSSTYLLSSGNTITGLTRLVGIAGLYLRMMTSGGEVAGSITVPPGGTLALYTPDGGTTPIALPNFTAFHIGIRYDATFETQNIDSLETEGLMKTSGAVFVRLLESGRPSIKDPNDLINQIPLNSMPTYPFTGSVRYDASDTARTDKTVRFVSNDDVPVTIQSIKAVITIGDAI